MEHQSTLTLLIKSGNCPQNISEASYQNSTKVAEIAAEQTLGSVFQETMLNILTQLKNLV